MTFGFGIILAEGGHGAFRDADPEIADAIAAASLRSRDRVFSLDGEDVFIEGGPWGGGIARLKLLAVLQQLCRERGVALHFGARIENPDQFDADLIVGADGVNSIVRRAYEGAFGSTSWTLCNRMAWYGTTRPYATPILSFRRTAHGNFGPSATCTLPSRAPSSPSATAMPGSAPGSIACPWKSASASARPGVRRRARRPPAAQQPPDWAALPVIRCRNWFVGHRVLIGDALHSPHPSIGSGTRIAGWRMRSRDRRLGGAPWRDSRGPSAVPARAPVQSAKLVTAMEKSWPVREHRRGSSASMPSSSRSTT
ncbi:MAG: hypothetical protein U1F11_05985 [Steroidobacteraceae bacterium]